MFDRSASEAVTSASAYVKQIDRDLPPFVATYCYATVTRRLVTYGNGCVFVMSEGGIMADKKLRKSLDGLRSDVQELAEAFVTFRDQVTTQQAIDAAERQSQQSARAPAISERTHALEEQTRASQASGFVSAHGFFDASQQTSDNHSYKWSLDQYPIQDLLTASHDRHAHVLAAIGHPQRLNILMMLLEEPATANDVVSDLELGTTGAAYHHLNVLQAAGLVEQQHRGIFIIAPSQIPVVLTILACLSNRISIEIADETAELDEQPENGNGTITAAL